jgi:tetratricopeptide (TPR) repeat protein
MDQMLLSARADQQYTKALELDDHHFGARISKAISYTFYPSIAGKAPEAIKHFEILRQRHGKDRTNDDMRMVYLNLGNEYLKMGNRDKAKAAYREGLATFPHSKEIRAALEAMD